MKSLFVQLRIFIIFYFLFPSQVKCLGVLSHEAIIDAAWDKSIVPLLKLKFPSASSTELKDAHAYAYGGAVTPDMGFYPFGSHLFTDLVHYVRSGDMVDALLKDATTLNQYAFAIGFLSHYNADNVGHPLATNRSVALVYPKMQKKFGDIVTYADNKISHMRMEFGFDVLQTAKGNYASTAYHDFIGFKVDTAVLAKAFLETYGLDINKVFENHLPLTIEVFRFTVANIFPLLTKSGWAARKHEILKKDSTATSRHFRYQMRVREYNKKYGSGYKHPGFFPTVLSFMIRVLPKAGPTRALKFKAPTPQAEKYFDIAFDSILIHFRQNINELKEPYLSLKDKDFDTGNPTIHCEYILADETYNRWLLDLDKNKFKNMDAKIKNNILNFYGKPGAPPERNKYKYCRKVFNSLKELKENKISY